MIRIEKGELVPASLTTTKAYDGEDVKQQLIQDQHQKCYLCERIVNTDFQIEHLRSQEHNAEYRQQWNNLFLACSYCNAKKHSFYDDIADPTQTNIEQIIKHEIDFVSKIAKFTSLCDTQEINRTILLLQKIHNGQSFCRKIREELFFEQVLSTVNDFMQLVMMYLDNPTPEAESAVRSSLSITKPALGFKYWIVKSNPTLDSVFSRYIVWNKKK